MKQIKLEVGKTYRSREGNEVKIIENDGIVEYSYEGSDGEWYTENGKWSYVSEEHPKDLIEDVEEVPSETRHTFAIPDGVKKVTVEQVGNRIVVEMVPEEVEPKAEMLKKGDVVFEDGRIMIVKMHPNFYHAMFYPNYGKLCINGQYGIPFTTAAFRPATPEEAQPLWDALRKAGKKWNAETMQVEDVSEIDRIREWVEEHLDEEDIAEAIEAYLKYREGEK